MVDNGTTNSAFEAQHRGATQGWADEDERVAPDEKLPARSAQRREADDRDDNDQGENCRSNYGPGPAPALLEPLPVEAAPALVDKELFPVVHRRMVELMKI